jgi:hypothetical protein
LAVSAGANAKAVQRILGHAKASMTLDVYADLSDADLDDVAVSLDAAIRSAADTRKSLRCSDFTLFAVGALESPLDRCRGLVAPISCARPADRGDAMPPRTMYAIALQKLLDFMPRYEVDFDRCERVHMANVVGWKTLPAKVLN